MTYVDGFVFAVPTANKETFRKRAAIIAEAYKENGALQVMECWADDVPDGKVTSFPLAVQRKEGETVCFSWILWPSKEARDVGNEKVFQDPRMQAQHESEMFDGTRMIYGGFSPIVEV